MDPGEVVEPAELDDKHTVRHVVFQNVNFFKFSNRRTVKLRPAETWSNLNRVIVEKLPP